MLGKASLIAQLVKNPPAMQETPGLIPGLGRSTGEGIGYPLQCSGLENSMDCKVHGVTKSRACLSDSLHFTSFHFQSYPELVSEPRLCLSLKRHL